MVCFCYRRRSVALPRLSADGKFIRRLATGCYQELYDMPNPTAEAQTPVEIGKTNILDQRRRIDRPRELIAGLERDGSPDLVAVRILGEMEEALAQMEAHHDAAQEQPPEASVDEPNSAKVEPLR
jgi:hypothetical protein